MPPINPVSLAIAALIPLIVGFFWYNPKGMGRFLVENDGSGKTSKGHHPGVYLLTILFSALIAMLISAILSTHEPAEVTLMHGLFHGSGAAVFMAVPAFAVIAMFEGKNATYIAVHAFYWIVSMALMGMVLGLFGL